VKISSSLRFNCDNSTKKGSMPLAFGTEINRKHTYKLCRKYRLYFKSYTHGGDSDL
jgi:hypothetical protein